LFTLITVPIRKSSRGYLGWIYRCAADAFHGLITAALR